MSDSRVRFRRRGAGARPGAELTGVRRQFDLTEGRGVVGNNREVVAGIDGDDGDAVDQPS